MSFSSSQNVKSPFWVSVGEKSYVDPGEIAGDRGYPLVIFHSYVDLKLSKAWKMGDSCGGLMVI